MAFQRLVPLTMIGFFALSASGCGAKKHQNDDQATEAQKPRTQDAGAVRPYEPRRPSYTL